MGVTSSRVVAKYRVYVCFLCLINFLFFLISKTEFICNYTVSLDLWNYFFDLSGKYLICADRSLISWCPTQYSVRYISQI